MQQREIVSGFSELKELLIRTYKIETERSQVKLYFSMRENQLLMHEYSDHKKEVLLAKDAKLKKIDEKLTGNAKQIVLKALKDVDPVQFLNIGFQLYGFFRF